MFASPTVQTDPHSLNAHILLDVPLVSFVSDYSILVGILHSLVYHMRTYIVSPILL